MAFWVFPGNELFIQRGFQVSSKLLVRLLCKAHNRAHAEKLVGNRIIVGVADLDSRFTQLGCISCTLDHATGQIPP